MKHLKLLLLISVFLLCSCSASEDNKTSYEVTSAPTETPIPTPQMVTYTDELFKYTFDRSLLQHQYSQNSDALQEGIAFSGIHTDTDAAITNGSCVYAGLMPLENAEQYTSLQQYPEACVTALFNGVFGIDETTSTTVDVINNIYEFQATYNGYICKGKLLHCTENSCAVLVYKVSDTEDDVLVSAFDDLYNSVTVNLEFFSSSDDNITLTPASEPTVTPKPTAIPTEAPKVSKLFTTVYLPYANREKPWLFSSVETFVKSCGYSYELTEPTSDVSGKITVSDTNGDYVFFAFGASDSIMTISFYQSSTNSEISLSNYSTDGSATYDTYSTHVIGEQENQVSSTIEQQSFLFN